MSNTQSKSSMYSNIQINLCKVKYNKLQLFCNYAECSVSCTACAAFSFAFYEFPFGAGTKSYNIEIEFNLGCKTILLFGSFNFEPEITG